MKEGVSMAADGAVVLDVDMNVSDAEKELSRLKTRVIKLEDEIAEKAFKRSDISSQLVKARKELEKLQADVPSAFEDGQWADNSEYYDLLNEAEQKVSALEKEHKKINEEIEATNLTLEYTKMRYGEILPLAEDLRKEENARVEAERQAKEAAKAAAQQAKEEAKIAAQQARDAERQAREQAKREAQIAREASAAIEAQIAQQRLLDIKENSVVSDQKLVDLQEELTRITARRKELESAGVGLGYEEYDNILVRTQEINQEIREYQDGLLNATNGTEQMGNAMDKADKKTNSIAKRLKGILASAFIFNILSSGLRNFTSWLGNAVKSNDQAAEAIARLKGALLTLAQPILNVVIPAFITLVNIITKVVSAIASVVSMIFGTTAEKSAEAAESLYDQQKGLKGVGSAAKKASKQLANFDEINKLSSEDSGGGGSGGGAGIEPNFDTSFIEGELEGIAFLVGSALLAVGAILTFSGVNVPLGITLMAAGALTIASAITTNWGAIATMLQGPIGIVMAVLGGAFLVIGAVLAFSGTNIPLGIAMMAIGAGEMAAVITANWGAISQILQGPIGAVVAVVSGALLAIGALLVFSGANIPLGLGLMIAGAIGMAAFITANWETIQSLLAGPVGAVVALVSGALLALGVILLFTGANIFLGLGMIAVGAIGLAASISANWETVQTLLQGPIGVITGLLSTAFLVLGAVLTFTGANIPLGIGLLIAGALGLATSIAANWDFIQNALQGPVGTVVAMVSAALLALGAIILFTGALVPLGLGLIVVGAIGLATSIAANWSTVQNALGGPIGAVTALVSGALLVLGVVLLFSGAGIPLGLGLMAVGAAGLVAVITPNWNYIKDAISGAYNDMIQWWNSNASQFFTLEYWAGLAKNMLDGLFGGLKNLGSRISDWGGSFINGVKDFFGIHSPADSTEEIGYYLMAGLDNGVVDNSDMVISAFSVIFTAITALCTQNTDLMKASIAAFLLYFAMEFGTQWMKSWEVNYQNAHNSIQLVIGDIDRLNQKLAAIERNITITITTIQRTVSESVGSSSGSKSTVSSSRMAAMPSIQPGMIPALAQGAVIPPNREFLAVLGDQRHGNNLEGPEDMFRSIVRQESGGNGQMLALLQAILSAIKEGKTIEVDRQVFGRVVHKANSEESRRVGVSFAGG